MAYSDCEKCWNSPCDCGWDYKDINDETFSYFLASICQYRSKEEAKKLLNMAIENVDSIEHWKDKE